MNLFVLLLPCLLAVPSFAQGDPPNGYLALTEAGALIVPGPNGGQEAPEHTSVAENLRLERLAVTRNAPALQRLREALQAGITPPPEEPSGAIPYSQFRLLARQLVQEGDVRAADGNFEGATNSRLDCVQLGAKVSRFSPFGWVVGSAMESLGMDSAINGFASHLDANQCRAAIDRLTEIEAERPNFVDVLRAAEKGDLLSNLELLTLAKNTTDSVFSPASKAKGKPTPNADPKIAQLSPEEVTANNRRLFDAAVKNAALPFQQAKLTKLPHDLDPLTMKTMNFKESPYQRFLVERDVTRTRLLKTGLHLRLVKLETGIYPLEFQTPVDSFSPELKPLVYRRIANKYLLYSVGPDGKDDGGKPLLHIVYYFDPVTGDWGRFKRKSVDLESKGDMASPLF